MEWSEWATPIVPVPKKDGSVRLCGDYKAQWIQNYKQKSALYLALETFLQTLLVGRNFQIDLRQAYYHLEIEEDSKKYLIITTHMGLFQYDRLEFGNTSAPAIR